MKKRVKIGNLKVFYRQKGKGAPLLLLHGWGKSGEVFSSLQKSLSKEFTTFAPDLPGFGKTSKPPESWGVAEYTRLVIDFAQKLGILRFHLLGHSFGGRISIRLAVSHPQKIEKLVLTGVPVLRKKGLKRFCFWIIAKVVKLIFFLPPLFLFKNQSRKLLYFLAGERDYYRSRGVMRQVLKKVIKDRPFKVLKKIKNPTLIIWGEDDRVTPLTHARALHRGIDRSVLKIVSGASHKLPYEKPGEFFKKIVPFLKQ